MILKQDLEIAMRILGHLKQYIDEIERFNMLERLSVYDKDYESMKTVDAFVLNFIKLQDHLGQRVFKGFLNAIGEYKDYMSFIDILDKLEKLNIIASSDEWLELRKLRNRMTHEYLNEVEKIKQEIEIAISSIPAIENAITSIINYLKQRDLYELDI